MPPGVETAAGFRLYISHGGKRTPSAFDALLHQLAQLVGRVAEQITALRPFAHGVANGFAGRSILTNIDRMANKICHLSGEGDRDFLDSSHGTLAFLLP